MLLLKVQAGSRLYGYATDASDDDYLEVHTQPFMISTREAPRQVKQTIVDGLDVIQMTLSTFVERASSGSHQALDAMFAPEPLVDEIAALRENFHVGYEIVPTYVRIITKFAVQEGYRKQRHALRAMFNLDDMLKTGRYNPQLSQDRIDFILEKAHLPYAEFRELLIANSPVALEDKLPVK